MYHSAYVCCSFINDVERKQLCTASLWTIVPRCLNLVSRLYIQRKSHLFISFSKSISGNNADRISSNNVYAKSWLRRLFWRTLNNRRAPRLAFCLPTICPIWSGSHVDSLRLAASFVSCFSSVRLGSRNLSACPSGHKLSVILLR